MSKIVNVCAAVNAAFAISAADLSVLPNRADALYQLGEEAVFAVNAENMPGMQIVAEITGNYKNPVRLPLTLDEHGSAVIRVNGREPGMVMVKVETEGKASASAVAFSPELILPQWPEPADFDQFWSSAMAQLDTIPADIQLEEIAEYSNSDYTSYRISFANINDTRIYGFLTVPTGAGPYPVFFTVPGAGPRELKPVQMAEVDNAKTITMVINVFPFELPLNDYAAAEKLIEERYPDGYYRASDELADFFFYRAILGAARGLNYAAAHPKADGKHVVYWGSSQGGAMGIALAGLTGKLTAAVVNVPSEFGKLYYWNYLKSGNKELLKVGAYFAGSNIARRITVPVMVSAGMVDIICNPFVISEFYNQIPGEKSIRFVPGMGHDFDPEYQKMTAEFIQKYLSN